MEYQDWFYSNQCGYFVLNKSQNKTDSAGRCCCFLEVEPWNAWGLEKLEKAMELTLCNCSQKKLILATSLFQILVTRSMRQYISIVLTNEFLNLPCGSANKLVYTPLVIANYNSSQRHKKKYKCLRWYWEHKPVIQAIAVMKLGNFYELKAS